MKNKTSLLYSIGSLAGLLAVILFRRNLAAEAHLFSYFGAIPGELEGIAHSPETIRQIFQSPLAGICYFDFFDLINVLLVGLLFLPLLIQQIKAPEKKIIGWVSLLVLMNCYVFYLLADSSIYFLKNLNDTEALQEGIRRLSIEKSEWKDLALGGFYGFGLLQTMALWGWKSFGKINYAAGLLTNLIGLGYFFPGCFIGEYNYLFIVLTAPFTLWWHGNVALHVWRMRGGVHGDSRSGDTE